ncbi:TPA: hypothetical protein ACH3X2_012377 [Trebouxia sp. C0005]
MGCIHHMANISAVHTNAASSVSQGPCHGKGLVTLHLMSYSSNNKLVLLSVHSDLQQRVRSTAQQQSVLSCCSECILPQHSLTLAFNAEMRSTNANAMCNTGSN